MPSPERRSVPPDSAMGVSTRVTRGVPPTSNRRKQSWLSPPLCQHSILHVGRQQLTHLFHLATGAEQHQSAQLLLKVSRDARVASSVASKIILNGFALLTRHYIAQGLSPTSGRPINCGILRQYGQA